MFRLPGLGSNISAPILRWSHVRVSRRRLNSWIRERNNSRCRNARREHRCASALVIHRRRFVIHSSCRVCILRRRSQYHNIGNWNSKSIITLDSFCYYIYTFRLNLSLRSYPRSLSFTWTRLRIPYSPIGACHWTLFLTINLWENCKTNW